MTVSAPSDQIPTRTRSAFARLGFTVVLILCLSARPGCSIQGQSSGPVPPWEPPLETSRNVRALVAARWGVEPTELQMEWGTPGAGQILDDAGKVELLGKGRNGHWMVSFSTKDPDRGPLTVTLRTGVVCSQPFASKPLARGEVLVEASMDFRPEVHWGPPLDLPQPAEAGWVAQRRIQAGEALVAPGVQPPLLVVSGRPVQLTWSSGPLTISLEGTAVGSASLGERVFVRTEEGRRMAGVVTGPGTVLLSNPGTGGV